MTRLSSTSTMPALLAEAAANYSARTAVRFEGESVTYAQIAAQAKRFAAGLIGAGVVKGARVGLLMGNRPEWIVAAFGVWAAGGVLVPISTFATHAERDYVLRHCDASVLLVERALLHHRFIDELCEAYPEIAAGIPGRLRAPALPCLRRVIGFGIDAARGGVEPATALANHAADVPEALVDALSAEVTPADDAVIVYTSGTTAQPKAVLHAHRAPAIQARHFAASMLLSPDDRLWTTQPFFWVAGLAVSLGAPLVAGATLVLDEIFEPGAALARIEAERVTVIRAWRHQEQAMADHPDAASRDLSSIRKVNYASPLARLAGLTRDVWGTQGGYGLTETFTVACDLPADAPAALRDATAGRPLERMDVRIVDPDSGESLAAGREGEIAVRGTTLMRGYYKVEPERFLDADGFFRTGDLGFLDADGYLHWTGRLSTLIKTGGANVSPAEVEAVAARQRGVRTAVAVGVPHPSLGEIVVLCVVATEDAALDETALRAALRAELAAYKVPKRILEFADAEIPRTANAKVKLAALRELVAARLATTSEPS